MTTNEELNTALFEKMDKEQKKYQEWLLKQPPEEILKNSYAYCMRENIVFCMEQNDLSDKQCAALLESATPVADVYSLFERREKGEMDVILDTIQWAANIVLRDKYIKAIHEGR